MEREAVEQLKERGAHAVDPERPSPGRRSCGGQTWRPRESSTSHPEPLDLEQRFAALRFVKVAFDGWRELFVQLRATMLSEYLRGHQSFVDRVLPKAPGRIWDDSLSDFSSDRADMSIVDYVESWQHSFVDESVVLSPNHIQRCLECAQRALVCRHHGERDAFEVWLELPLKLLITPAYSVPASAVCAKAWQAKSPGTTAGPPKITTYRQILLTAPGAACSMSSASFT